MSHIIIIRGGEYDEHLEPGQKSAEIQYAPQDGLTIAEEVELFKENLKLYRKAVGMPIDPE